MRSYGQFCPVAKAAELFCERWTALIIRDLAAGASRFSELHRGVPLISPTLLARRLRQLVDEGVVERQRDETGKTWRYRLSEAGQEFVPLVEALGVWGQRWTRRRLKEEEIDLGLAIWSLERSVEAAAFRGPSSLVRLELTDQPAHKRLWWFLNEGERCTLCVDDPGHGVDLYLACTLPDLIYLLRGDLTLQRARGEERLEVIGEAEAEAALAAWLNLGPLTEIASARNETV